MLLQPPRESRERALQCERERAKRTEAKERAPAAPLTSASRYHRSSNNLLPSLSPPRVIRPRRALSSSCAFQHGPFLHCLSPISLPAHPNAPETGLSPNPAHSPGPRRLSRAPLTAPITSHLPPPGKPLTAPALHPSLRLSKEAPTVHSATRAWLTQSPGIQRITREVRHSSLSRKGREAETKMPRASGTASRQSA